MSLMLERNPEVNTYFGPAILAAVPANLASGKGRLAETASAAGNARHESRPQMVLEESRLRSADFAAAAHDLRHGPRRDGRRFPARDHRFRFRIAGGAAIPRLHDRDRALALHRNSLAQ